MKKIVVYLARLSPSGGKERVVANLLNEWNKRYDLTLITKDSKPSFYTIPQNIRRISLDSPFISDMYNMKASRTSRAFYSFINMKVSISKLKKILSKIDYDYIYVTSPLNAYEAYKAMKEPGKKLVISEHASINAYNSIYSKMKTSVYPNAYCISVPNTMDTEEYKTWGCNSEYVPHPITFEADRTILNREKVVLNVGRLTSDKQQDILIKIWKTIDIEKRAGWELWIVGSGEDENKLKLMAQRKDDHTIKFISATKNIEDIYKKASVFVLTSKCEGFGMVLLEAMAFGVPCISFDCPSGPRDVIDNSINGYLVPDKDATAFRCALEKILSLSENELRIMRDNAYKKVEEWNTEMIMKKWDQIFK